MTFGHIFMITLARIDGTILSCIVSWGCSNHYREDVCVGPGESASAKRVKNQRGLRGEAGRKGRQSAFMFVCVCVYVCVILVVLETGSHSAQVRQATQRCDMRIQSISFMRAAK